MLSSPSCSEPTITVAICTRNRAHYLPDLFAALLKQSYINFELLLVDNASDDKTAEVANEHGLEFADLKYVREATVGIAIARNTAVLAAKGDIVCFIDDDVLPTPEWLDILVRPLRQNAAIGIVGGPLLPLWAGGKRPEWLSMEYEPVLGLLGLRFGNRSGLCDSSRSGPWGGNMAFRRDAFLAMGGCPEFHAPRQAYHFCEDTRIVGGIMDAGWLNYFSADAVVYHRVPEERLSKSFLDRRSFQIGQANAVTSLLNTGANQKPVITVSLSILRLLLASSRFVKRIFLRRNAHIRFIDICYEAGFLSEFLFGRKQLSSQKRLPRLNALRKCNLGF